MKLFFSLFISLNAQAFEAVVINFQNNHTGANIARDVLVKNFNFPSERIEIRQNECLENENTMLQICAQDNGEFRLMRINEYYVKNYFGEFIKKSGAINEI